MLRLSVDDGCKSDLRVAVLAEKYEVKCIFYWPVEWHSLAYEKGYLPLNYLEAMQIAQSHEIGSHTVTHRHLTWMEPEEARIEIADSKLMLSRLFKQDIKKFCPPRGYTNDELTEYTLGLYESQRLTKGDNLVHIHPDSGANGNRPWREVYNDLANKHDVVECWGHSWEWDKFNLWEEIEDFLSERSRT